MYAQHDEPVSFRDAEYFDPTWLDTVADACQHSNKSVRLTALAVLNDIKSDTAMRHRHSRIAIFEARLSAPQTPKVLAQLRQAALLGEKRSRFSPRLDGDSVRLLRKSRWRE
jgi:hypothetical protein